ncbi:MAG TPA: TetR/AcrR family transcriptional regulator [Candidatus Fournierella excrementigallinarum]|nr:TetR/AcrR family transcriptional regulator [Candidatus Fournierella excrementigallinarum]
MPPAAKVTREMVLQAALDITRRAGFEAVNARSVAARLGCSTRPIFTCYENMEAMKADFLEYAFAFYEQRAAAWGEGEDPCLALPLAYLRFAREEPLLFRALFIREMALDMRRAEDFYREPGNVRKAEAFARRLGVDPRAGREIFLDLFLWAHGAAVLAATGKLKLDDGEARRRAKTVVAALAAPHRP